MTSRTLAVLALLLLSPGTLHAQTPVGTVTGIVADPSTGAPLENASVVLRSRVDSTRVVGTTTRRDGGFEFDHVPLGAYVVECSLIGHSSFRSPEFVLGPASLRIDLRTIVLKPSALVLDEVVINSEKSLFNHTIDRRVYNVDHDLMAKSSSVSDLLQNIPSVQVDIDGNVSLRGSQDVMVLINGKKSPLMGKGRADVLQQLPAATIEKIEVITNPSARFTPEGTSGIINIVTKKGAGSGVNGDLTGHVGAASRHNENLSFGYHPGKLDLFGNYSYRDDRRRRSGTDERIVIASGSTQTYREDNRITTRPHANVATLGLSYHPGPKNTLDLSAEYFQRRPTRNGVSTIVTGTDAGTIGSDFDRLQTGDESEHETGLTGAFQHDFTKEDHTLRIEANVSDAPQTERAHFVEHWRTPARSDAASNLVFRQAERQGQLSLDYTNPVDEESKLEAGYALELQRLDIRSDAESLDVARAEFSLDPSRTYRFRLDQAIHAVYGTYERSLGKFSVLGGLRGEVATLSSELVTGAPPFAESFSGIYPTLHMAYQATKRGQFQLNYSRRIRRPDGEDLNPFPEFTDPYNIDSGNPRLRPESIHSFELGYRLKGERLSFSPSVYFRDRRNGFTRLTQAVNDSTFLRTLVNLASDRSAGLEPVLTLSLGRTLQANLNGNVFYDQIDASNIGYADKKSVFSWSGTFGVTVTPWSATMFQLSSNYRSARLTPQGDSRPSFVLNLGARQMLHRDRVSLTFAVSDLLKTQEQETRLNVSGIEQRVKNRRDAQVVYAGVTYHYGRPEKNETKEKVLPYEDQP